MKRTFAAFLVLCTLPLFAQKESPLTALPFTPVLDVKSMDKNTNPCVDFYQYSCGGWIASNPIPADQAAWSVYGKTTDENSHFLWGILDEVSKPGANRTPVQQKIGDYFASCMDEAKVDAQGIKPLTPWLDRIDALILAIPVVWYYWLWIYSPRV